MLNNFGEIILPCLKPLPTKNSGEIEQSVEIEIILVSICLKFTLVTSESPMKFLF